MSAEEREMTEPSKDEIRAARATAYVLGELPAEERPAFEEEIAADEALATEIADLREMTGMLAAELGREVPAPEPKSAIKPVGATLRALPRPRHGRWLAALAMAAAFGLAGPVYFLAGGGPKGEALDLYKPAFYFGERETTKSELIAPGESADGKSWGVVDAVASPYPALGPNSARGVVATRSKAKGATTPGQAPPTNSFGAFDENPFVDTSADKQSTFSIDVDTASYAIMRSFLSQNARPPKEAVRIEEMLNSFSYDYAKPTNDAPFAIQLDMGVAPWAESHRLVRVGLRGKDVTLEEKEGANLVFLIDTSGSMSGPNRLPLLRESLKLLVAKMGKFDRISIVTYAGSAGLVLPTTRGDKHDTILAALNRLQAGGSTNGGSGIELAYKVAKEQFINGGVNRVILCTDGDFNVGVTSATSLVDMVAARAKSGVFLSVLGFGMGNLKDSTLEQIADKGDGNYAYIDSLDEGRRVLVDGLGNLVTIAKDVKIQITFDPKHVRSFRLIGYENRVMGHQDFADDQKDAGELGSGHTVTALYEIVPKVDGSTADFMKVELRYKEPEGGASKLITAEIGSDDASAQPSADFRFAAGVAAFGMLLRGSPHRGTADWAMAERLIQAGVANDDENGRRKELLDLVKKAATLSGR